MAETIDAYDLGLRVAVPARNLIGESPLWDARDQTFYWVDVEGRLVQHFDAQTGEVRRWPVPEAIGCIGLRETGGLVAAISTGFVVLDTDTGDVAPLTDPEADLPGNRFNDGKTDRHGRFWAGTKNLQNSPQASGSVYRLDPDGRTHSVYQGVSCTNGIAWSPDNRIMYLCDTWIRHIYAFDFDFDAGTISNRRLFAQLTPEQGFPDGLTVDTEGFIWNAHYDGWRITRYAPDGTIERVIGFPVQHVTSLTFGDADLRTLYVTSASARLAPDVLTGQPLAGHVFSLRPGVRGIAEPLYFG